MPNVFPTGAKNKLEFFTRRHKQQIRCHIDAKRAKGYLKLTMIRTFGSDVPGRNQREGQHPSMRYGISKFRVLGHIGGWFMILTCSLLGTFLDDGHAQPAPDRLPIAFAARVVGDANRARLIVDFDKEVEHDIYLMDNPRRIVIDLPETIFSLKGELARLPRSLVGDLRYGTVHSGQSRIVLELNRAVSIAGQRLKIVNDGQRHRLLVDLVSATEQSFSNDVRKVGQFPGSDTRKSATGSPGKFTIVVDPGHGGADGGASGANRTIEKHITLEFALKLRTALAKYPQFNVQLTREDDRFMGLLDRLKLARERKADLFLSIHADSLAQRNIRGATVYTLSDEGSDELSRLLAKEQNRADLVAGLELPAEEPRVYDILIDMTRRETEAFSTQFAELLVERMRDNIKMIRNPHRSADFYVLKSPEVPSVLLELGYLSNPQDALLMESTDWQTRAIESTVAALVDFFSTRTAQQ